MKRVVLSMYPGKDPNEYRQPQDSFFAYVEALIVSTNAKTLAIANIACSRGVIGSR